MDNRLKLLERYSTPAKALADPAPDEDQLNQILEIAMSAPDHGRLRPYRFITIRGDARHALSEVFGRATKQRDPDVPDDYLKKQKDKPLRSPLIVVVVASPQASEKIPEIEQILSAGAAAHNILLASNAIGFGSVWLTGANAYDAFVCEALGLNTSEKIIGFIYLGTAKYDMSRSETPDLADKLSNWSHAATIS